MTLIDPDQAMTYLEFVAERHRVWEARQAGAPQPWTADPVLAARKFTNVFRVLDPGSQFVLEFADPEDSPEEVLMRCFLYRYTNLPQPWRNYRADTGAWPYIADLDAVQEHWQAYRDAGHQMFSGAYMILPYPKQAGDKIEQCVRLVKRCMDDGLMDDFFSADTQAGRLAALTKHVGVGDFLGMQILTDWGYTPHCGEDREEHHIVLGPGSIKGIRALAPGLMPRNLMDGYRWAVDAVRAMPDVPLLEVPNEGGQHYRLPSLMDIQNTLCEFSKYHRFAAKPVSPRPYQPAHPGPQPKPMLPTHW